MSPIAVKLTTTMGRRPAGFSLMEMAIVLMIMGVLMSGVLVSVSQTTVNARRAAALAQLRQVEEALYGFAQSQGRLPCPASNSSIGQEAGTAGACTLTHGFVPSATLGIFGQVNDEGLLLDPWANPLRYSLARTASAGNPDFSLPTNITSFFTASTVVVGDSSENCDDNTISTAELLQICNKITDPLSPGIVLANTAPAVIISMGDNWSSFTSTNENTNAGGATLGTYPVHDTDELVFISSPYIEDQFDDQLVWLSPYVLFNRMVSAGKL